MSGKRKPDIATAEEDVAGENFLQRFSRRKTEAREMQIPALDEATGAADAEAAPELTDADMPPLETLDESSDYSGFLSEKVSETLRRAALRKLFHGSAFNVIDELDDYAEDFSTFAPLGDLVTADMRHRIEVEARQQAERLAESIAPDETETDTAEARDTAALVQETPATKAQAALDADDTAEPLITHRIPPQKDDEIPTDA